MQQRRLAVGGLDLDELGEVGQLEAVRAAAGARAVEKVAQREHTHEDGPQRLRRAYLLDRRLDNPQLVVERLPARCELERRLERLQAQREALDGRERQEELLDLPERLRVAGIVLEGLELLGRGQDA